MKLTYPSISEIPLRGTLEHVGGAASLLEKLSFSGAVGVLKIGESELHVRLDSITHAIHSGFRGEAAALAILQLEQGQYHFYGTDPMQTMVLPCSSTTLKAMKQLDELRAEVNVVTLPNLSIALEYLRGVGGLDGWQARFAKNQQRSSLVFERQHWRVIALEATWSELMNALKEA